MEQVSVKISDVEYRPVKARPSPVLAWLISLAKLQPIGFVVMCAFVFASIFNSMVGFALGGVSSFVLTVWLGGSANGNVRPSETE